ncbi:MAG: UDP-N-acetylmuramoyl-tripeptide--D-alanyl-D-alanine ligase [Candidatus Sungbacteria bacterium]|uniref:UDP-N-acetylmuramoyl-tripeptide--D-alanyl-D-alanine ligase n=1 Tax=Candidatus Sungiibacteriota bacterium TaxID=2750080 RepID=A0A931SDC0_9BACT|nr:UDP-N-acetylmuramoyl-tripeptide--D-alanyl-D-alanine ligase [Candidatus Sungbacteria bacterium]
MILITKILRVYLYVLAKAILRRHHPRIIGITGGVGKTSARDAIYAVLSSRFRVWRGREEKNYNNEIGVPLVILGAPHYGRNVLGWLGLCLRFLKLWWSKSYPEILILEMGVDRPGDMDYLVKLARPNAAVITGLGQIPVHVEFFKDPEAVAKEKAKILGALANTARAILNADDEYILAMAQESPAPVMRYGMSQAADVRVEELQVLFLDENGKKTPEGIAFKIRYQGALIPLRLAGAINKPQALAAAAGFCAGIAFGMNPVSIAEALSHFVPPPGRMRILKGIKGAIILDDTYNAAPAAMESAIETLGSLPAKRRIAVLGDMLELGSYTEEAHRRVGKMIPSRAEILFTVGSNSQIVQKQALEAGLDRSRAYHIANSRDAAAMLRPMIESGDVILVKGGQSMRMERVAEAIMAEPNKAKDLLTRQSVDWKRKV